MLQFEFSLALRNNGPGNSPNPVTNLTIYLVTSSSFGRYLITSVPLYYLCPYGSHEWEQLRTETKLTVHSSLSKRTIWSFKAQKSCNVGYFGLDVGEAPGLWDTGGRYVLWERKTRKQRPPPPKKKFIKDSSPRLQPRRLSKFV